AEYLTTVLSKSIVGGEIGLDETTDAEGKAVYIVSFTLDGVNLLDESNPYKKYLSVSVTKDEQTGEVTVTVVGSERYKGAKSAKF
ncbi:MAG: hypothetical protein GX891_03855, partial [Clostridiales bacterium]|nr:hypothetical protein [Clostridiales bacterium]